MNKVDILKTPFLEFTSDMCLADRIYAKLKTEEFYSNNLSTNSVSNTKKNWYDEELINWFYDCLKQVHTYLDIVPSLSIEITGCWANKTDKLQNHHNHWHSNSWLSGVYYMQDHDSEIIFTSDNIWFEKMSTFRFCNKITSSESSSDLIQGPRMISKYKPKKGNLLIFPSHFPHKVKTVSVNQDPRYSISFNTFVSGTFENAGIASYCSIVSKSINT